jgi:transcriptional regulator with GAF, ATPase, and Fis domain
MVEGDRLLARDLGSAAGTRLNGVALEGTRALAPGDRLDVGGTEVRVVLAPSGGQAEAPVLTGDLERDRRNVELLLRTVLELHASRDLEDVLRRIVDRALALAGGARGAVLLRGSARGPLETAIARDALGRDLAPGEALTRALPARAVEGGRAVVLTDTARADQREEATPSVVSGALGSVLAVPLPSPEGPIGVLYVDSRRPAEGFGPAELAFFEALAAHCGLAVERARLAAAEERRRADERRRLEAENRRLRARLGADEPIGESPAMRAALDLGRRVAASDLTVLVTGETGTGKEVFARRLHALSARAGGPFVAVDCGAIPESLIESELFGHERGAFTGALDARPGRFREAQGGTLLLDEIGELPLALQPRLLRVLQERTVSPLGGRGPVAVDVRVLAATHRDLAAMVKEGRFRQDLYYRISAVTIALPPLRERGEDALILARAFLARHAEALGRPLRGFTREALDAIAAHRFPGNVRELEHAVHRAVVLAEPPYVTRRDLGLPAPLGAAAAEPAPAAPAEGALPFPKLQEARAAASARFEREYVFEALRRAGGGVTRAAALAGVSRQLLQRLMKRHGIDKAEAIDIDDEGGDRA